MRLSGTPEELESFHGLERAMQEAGFSTELILHDAYISLPGRCSVQVGGRELRAITHSMSTPTPGLTAPLVPAGIGDSAAFAAAVEPAYPEYYKKFDKKLIDSIRDTK